MTIKRSVPWFAAGFILIIIFGTIYAAVQQSQRLAANYPQVQLAEDKAAELNNSTNPAELVSGKINVSHSLAPFTIIYDRSGKVMAGSGYLNGSIPVVPLGVLTAANGKPYHFVTWQPEPNVRIAAVSVSANKYYVLSGRSLTEVEKNENKTFLLAALGGIASLLVLAAAYYVSLRQ